MLNIDWLKSCKHTEYNIGAIYISVMNLSQTLRFCHENILLIVPIPGPKEPKIDINVFYYRCSSTIDAEIELALAVLL